MDLSRRTFLATAATGAWLTHTGTGMNLLRAGGMPVNPFLEGPFAPVREEITVDNLKVIGSLPRELDGLFVRNGPNPQFAPRANYHIFEGDGMLHGLRLRDGVASYRNRYVRTAGWRQEHAAGKALWPSVLDAVNAKQIAIDALAGRAPVKNTGNTALLAHHDKLLALWEVGAPHEIDAATLDTVGPYDFSGQWKQSFTAHPKVDAVTGELVCFGYSPISPVIAYGVFDHIGRLTHYTTIKLRRPIMMHDFAITRRHTLFLDLPATIDLGRALAGTSSVMFEPDIGARVGILGRNSEGEQIRWFEINPCFVFHTLNAYDDGDEVVLFAARYDHFPSAVSFAPGPRSERIDWSDGRPAMCRWRFNLVTGKVSEERLDDACVEMPRANDALIGAKSRYGYAVEISEPSSLLKYDVESGTKERHSLGQGRVGGEGVFVAREDAKTEDDGWLISYVYDQSTDKGEAMIVNARAFAEPTVARIMIPQRVPFGFHGAWLPASFLK